MRTPKKKDAHRPTAFAGEGQRALLNYTSTCGARVWLAPRIGRILPPPPTHAVSVCTFGCIAHVTYRNWNKILEYDVVVSRE